MAKGESGRIVVELNPELKCELYSALALEGKTLKDWVIECSNTYLAECEASDRPSRISKYRVPKRNDK